MSKILVIAGHGKNRDGSFDPGAKGFITKGEHKYYVENFFPAVRKHLPAGHKVVLFSDYNVYDRQNIVALAKSYGSDTQVIEMHYDATGSSEASGGHVIVHADFAPDTLDLKLRDWIKKHIGVRYNHKGHTGISGRDNLGNCNRCKTGGINYRLIELGFGTNKKDSDTMINNVNNIAKDFVQVICGTTASAPVTTKPTKPTVGGAKSHKVVKGDTLWSISKKYGVTVANLKAWNSLKSDLIVPGQTLNLQATVSKPAAKPVAKKTYVQLAKHEPTWRAYRLGAAPVEGNEVGFLAPRQYGGLEYQILGYENNGTCAIIQTQAFGKVKIFIKDPSAKIVTR